MVLQYRRCMDEAMKAYFEKIKNEGFPFRGELSDYDVRIEGDKCRGGGSADDIVFFIKKEGNVVKDISYVCNYCIPPSYVASDLLCRFAKGKTFSQIRAITYDDVVEMLGGESPSVFDLLMGIVRAFPDE